MNALLKERQFDHSDGATLAQGNHLKSVKNDQLPKRPTKNEALRRRVGAAVLATLMLAGVGKGAVEASNAIKEINAVEQTSDAEIAWTKQGSKSLRQLNGTITFGEAVKVYGYPDNGGASDEKPNNLLTVVEHNTALIVENPSYVNVDGTTWMSFEYGDHSEDATKAERTAWVNIDKLGDQTRNSDGERFFGIEYADASQPFFDDTRVHQSQSQLVDAPH